MLSCALVGAESAFFEMEIDTSQTPSDLKYLVKTKMPNTLKAVDAHQLDLYLGKKDNKWLTVREVKCLSTLEGLKLLGFTRNLQHFGLSEEEMRAFDGADEDDESLPVHVLLTFDDDPVIRIPWIHLRGTGIGRSEQDLLLYRGTQLMNQWSQTRVCSVNTYALLWIVGPPGTGKSCAALSFVCSMDRNHWDVIWLHLALNDDYVNCAWFTKTQKMTYVIKFETLEAQLDTLLSSTSRPTIVFLDGYIKSSSASGQALFKCKRWRQADFINLRLVCICSMVSRGNDYRPELYHPIPSRVDIGDRMLSSEEKNSEGEETEANESSEGTYSEMLFQVESWKLDDYFGAIAHYKFFDHVVSKLSSYKGQTERSFAENSRVPRNKSLVGPLSLCDYSRAILRVSVISAQSLISRGNTVNAACEVIVGTERFQTSVVNSRSPVWKQLDSAWFEVLDQDNIEVLVFDASGGVQNFITSLIIPVKSLVIMKKRAMKRYPLKLIKGASLTLGLEYFSPESRKRKLLKAKYFVASGSAQLMFDLTTVQAIKILNAAIVAAPDIAAHLRGCVGDSSVNHLLARYYRENDPFPDIRLVSGYVAMRMATVMDPQQVLKFARAFAVNPATDGNIFEMRFFAELCSNDIVCQPSNFAREQWEKADVIYFNPDNFEITLPLNEPKWLAPIKWKPAGLDLIFVHPADKLLRFVQVARACQTHSFDSIHLCPF